MNDFWTFPYTRKYHLTHPWTAIRPFLKSLEYAGQRAFRGWDDRVLWGIDYHILWQLPIWLKEFKKLDHITPMAINTRQWNEILDDMIEGLEAGYKYISNDLPILDKALENTKDTIDFQDYADAIEALGGSEQINKESDELTEKFNKGFHLFHLWFFDLWS